MPQKNVQNIIVKTTAAERFQSMSTARKHKKSSPRVKSAVRKDALKDAAAEGHALEGGLPESDTSELKMGIVMTAMAVLSALGIYGLHRYQRSVRRASNAALNAASIDAPSQAYRPKNLNSEKYLSVCTFNMYFKPKAIAKLKELTSTHGFHVAALQEIPTLLSPSDSTAEQPFKAVCPKNHHTPECMAMTWTNAHSPWKISSTPTIVYSDRSCPTYRAAMIQTYIHDATKENIKVANVHLCGGRFDETNPEIFKDLNNSKLYVLIKVVGHNPDIIMGDFYSDLESKTDESGNHLSTNVSFLKGLKEVEWAQDTIKMWNTLPNEYLSKQGYVRAIPEINKRPTSRFGTTPDAIYYKPDRLKIASSGQEHIHDTPVSDHDLVWALFEIV